MNNSFILNKLNLLIYILALLKLIKTKSETELKLNEDSYENFNQTKYSFLKNENDINSIKNKIQNKYNYLTLRLTKKSIKQDQTKDNANLISQQFFQLSDATKLNIKHLDISTIMNFHKAISIEPIKIRNYYNMQYYANILVGAEKQEFSVIIDTGSNILWLPSSNCTLCRNYTHKYNELQSTTGKLLNKTLNITYGKGFVEGDLFSDEIYISDNFGVKNMYFLSVDKELQLDGTISDGLLGMGIYSENTKNFSFIYNLFTQNIINKPAFTFYLTDSSFSNRLYIGDIKENTQLADFWAQAQSCQVNNSSEIFSKYWACDVMSISTSNATFEKSNLDFLEDSKGKSDNNYRLLMNENNVNENISSSNSAMTQDIYNLNGNSTNFNFRTTSKAIFDTGSSLVFIPPNDFLNLIPYFSAKALDGMCTLSYSFQIHCKCKTPTDFGSIYLNFAKGRFIIDFESIIDYMPSSEYQCRFQMILDLFNFDTWILGDSVLRYSFITFDMQSREISFLQNSGIITDSNILGNENKNQNLNPSSGNQTNTNNKLTYLMYFIIFSLATLFAYCILKCYQDKDDIIDEGNYNRLANN